MHDLLKNRCRLCSKVSRKLIEIDKKLRDCICEVYRLQILISDDEDQLPKTICSKCLSNVDNFWKFFQNVQKAQKKLTKLLNDAIKQEDIEPSIVRYVSQPDGIYNAIQVREYAAAEPAMGTSFMDDDASNSTGCFKKDDCKSIVDGIAANVDKTREKHWPDYPWTCNVCTLHFTDFREYKIHSCFQLDNRFYCTDCPKVYSRLKQFIKHVIDCHRDRNQCRQPEHCDICKHWFGSNAEEQERYEEADILKTPNKHHLRRIKVDKLKLVCNDCGKQYKTNSQLNQHRKTHSGIKPFSCEECGKSFYVKGALKVHKNIHTGIKEFTCEECGRSFNEKGNLIAHISSHNTLRGFTCTVCSKPFKTSITLREHMSIHTGDKPHSCNECERTFRLRGQLQRHLRLHSQIKPYPCDFCHKRFRLKSVQVVHRRQHTGEQPFACSECPRRFAEWSNCHKHMKRMHGIPAKRLRPQDKSINVISLMS